MATMPFGGDGGHVREQTLLFTNFGQGVVCLNTSLLHCVTPPLRHSFIVSLFLCVSLHARTFNDNQLVHYLRLLFYCDLGERDFPNNEDWDYPT